MLRQAAAGRRLSRGLKRFFSLVQQVIRESGYEEKPRRSGIVITGGAADARHGEPGEEFFSTPKWRRSSALIQKRCQTWWLQARANGQAVCSEEARLARMQRLRWVSFGKSRQRSQRFWSSQRLVCGGILSDENYSSIAPPPDSGSLWGDPPHENRNQKIHKTFRRNCKFLKTGGLSTSIEMIEIEEFKSARKIKADWCRRRRWQCC
jgi:hypothetical protein